MSETPKLKASAEAESPVHPAVVLVNANLEIIHCSKDLALFAALTVDEALELSQKIVEFVARQHAARGTPEADKLQDALSQAWTWLGIALAAHARSRGKTAQDKLN